MKQLSVRLTGGLLHREPAGAVNIVSPFYLLKGFLRLTRSC